MSFISAGNTTTTTLLINGDTTGNLVFNTGGANTTALTITNAQNVGIGTTSPNNYFQVTGAKTNTDAASTGQMVIQDTTAYNSSPIAGIQFAIKYTSSGTYAFGTAIQGIKDNSTDGNFGQSLRFVTQANGASPSEKMRLDSNGCLLVGTTSSTSSNFKVRPSGTASIEAGDGADGGNYGVVQIVRPATQSDNIFYMSFVRQGNNVAGMGFLQNSGTFAIQNAGNNAQPGVALTTGSTTWGTTSDERTKYIIGNIDNALAKLSDWRSVYFKYKTDSSDYPQRVGLIAQEVQATLPEAVSVETDEMGTLQLRYSETIPLLVAAIKELNAKVDAQAAEIAALKAGA